MRIPYIRTLALAGLCALPCRPAAALPQATWSQAGVTLVRLYAPSGGFTPAQRTEEMDSRFTEILSGNDGHLTPGDIRMSRVGADYRITIRGLLLVTATQADASANHTRPFTLARFWLASMRKILPQLAPRVNQKGA